MSSFTHVITYIKTHILRAFVLLIVVAVAFWGIERINATLFDALPPIVLTLLEYGSWQAFLILGIAMLIGTLLCIPFFPFVFTAGMLFGFWKGLLFSVSVSLLSATLLYGIGYKGKPVLDRFTSIQNIEHVLQRHPFFLVFILRYVGVHFSIMSYAGGVSKLPFTLYIVATLLGELAYLSIYTYAGYYMLNVHSMHFVYVIIVLKAVLFATVLFTYGMAKYIVPYVYKRKKMSISHE